MRPRILCMWGSPDAPSQYVAVMNAIFSAQRAEVAVDALVLGADSAYLQQAAHLTGGLYMRAGGSSSTASVGGSTGAGARGTASAAAQGSGLLSGLAAGHAGGALQYLLSVFSADTVTRGMLRVHQPQGVDFRASCFCHKRPIDIGHVCSVCLAIFCQPIPQCEICEYTWGPCSPLSLAVDAPAVWQSAVATMLFAARAAVLC
jgi:transcription initiation factor TFIIH subunit 3